VHGSTGYAWEQSGAGPVISVYDLAAGSKLYSSASVSGGLVQQVAPFVGPDGTVFAPRTQNNVVTDYLVAYDDAGGALVERWRVPLGYVPFASFGIGPDSTVYSYSPSMEIWRIDPETGVVIDTSAPMAYNFPAQPRMAVDTRGIIYVTNGSFSSGRLYSFDLDLLSRWSEPITNVNIGGPAIGSSVLVVCGVGTDVRAYFTDVSITEGTLAITPGKDGIKIFPSPCRDRVFVRFSTEYAPGPENTLVRIFDAAGRIIFSSDCRNITAKETGLLWDCRDLMGRQVPCGVYMICLESGGETSVHSVTVMR
jgi:hypothetical protein